MQTITVTHATFLKSSPEPSSTLMPTERQYVEAGRKLPVVAISSERIAGHIKITLGKIDGVQQLSNGRNTIWVFAAHTDLDRSTGAASISQDCIDLLKRCEGCELVAYPDPGSGGEPWTIGYGTTKGVRPGMVITQAQAEQMLRQDLKYFEREVLGMVKVPLSQGQLNSLVCFCYNIGAEALQSSTLLQELNQKHYQQAANEFSRWVRASGRILPGLVTRRAAEKAMFEGKDWKTVI